MKIKNKLLDNGLSVVGIVLGTLLMSVGFRLFLMPHDVAPGGFSGIAMILSRIIERLTSFSFPVGILTLILNIPLFILSVRLLGSKFGIFSIIGVVMYSVLMDVLAPFEDKVVGSLPDEVFVCALYGGVIAGLGQGLVVKLGGSTGGSDMLGYMMSVKRPQFSVGSVVIIVDTFVLVCNAILTSVNTAFYAFIAIVAEGMAADFVIDGLKATKAYYIISEKSDDICKALLSEVHRGVTGLRAVGMYTRRERNMLLCLVTRTQVAALKRVVQAADPQAFMFSVSVKEVVGNGFSREQMDGTAVEIATDKQPPDTPQGNDPSGLEQ